MKKTKVFAAYLPQFHETEENNLFWGKGFTDWDGVKKAKPQYKCHIQPRIPLNGNYYDLSRPESIKWQAELANQYGISGFNIYHYWFKNGKKMLQTPAEIILNHPEIRIEYFFTWDNCSWVRSWSNIAGNKWAPEADRNIAGGKEVLLELDYGDEEQWDQHFNYLLPFFRDRRYLRINGCPVFAFMTSLDKDRLIRMGNHWKRRALENGLGGLYLLSRKDEFRNKHLFDAQFLYQPAAAAWGKRMSVEGRLQKYFKIRPRKDCEVKYFYDYEKVWRKIIRKAPGHLRKGLIPGAVCSFDDTPRRGSDARILHSFSKEVFLRYFSKLYKTCCTMNSDILLLTAWNEWGEGAYLEPDELNGYALLKVVKKAIDSCSE